MSESIIVRPDDPTHAILMQLYNSGLGGVKNFQHRGMSVRAFEDNGVILFSVSDKDLFQSTYGTNTVATPKDRPVEITDAAINVEPPKQPKKKATSPVE